MSKTERRRHPRADALLPMKLSLGDDSGEDMVETRIRNLSCSGIRFHAPHSLQLMSRVQIALELPDADQLLISGVVVRCDIADLEEGAESFDTAIFFDDLSESARKQLSQFVSTQLS